MKFQTQSLLTNLDMLISNLLVLRPSEVVWTSFQDLCDLVSKNMFCAQLTNLSILIPNISVLYQEKVILTNFLILWLGLHCVDTVHA